MIQPRSRMRMGVIGGPCAFFRSSLGSSKPPIPAHTFRESQLLREFGKFLFETCKDHLHSSSPGLR